MADDVQLPEVPEAGLVEEAGEDLADAESVPHGAEITTPVNAAVAANILSDGSIAYVETEEDAITGQSS